MTIHVTISEAKTRLSELVAAAVRGEEVVVGKAGAPRVRLVVVPETSDGERAEIAAKRASAFGMFAKEFEGWSTNVPPSMTDEQLEERFRRKFGPAA